jgi:hypothetical protein
LAGLQATLTTYHCRYEYDILIFWIAINHLFS